MLLMLYFGLIHMVSPNVTLADVYMKLEEIEERIERLEAIMARQQSQMPQPTQLRAPRPVAPPTQRYQYSPKGTVQPPQNTSPAQPEKEEPKKPPININNWRYLLGLE